MIWRGGHTAPISTLLPTRFRVGRKNLLASSSRSAKICFLKSSIAFFVKKASGA